MYKKQTEQVQARKAVTAQEIRRAQMVLNQAIIALLSGDYNGAIELVEEACVTSSKIQPWIRGIEDPQSEVWK